jgi:hypothetical protein
MKKIHPTFPVAVAIVLFISSCKKNLPFYSHNCDVPFNITSFRYRAQYTGWDTVTISYDQWNNPVRATRPNPSTGAPNFLFRYDAAHRLTDWIGPYRDGFPNGGAEFWHRYYYDGRNNIVIDSEYSLVSLVNGQISRYAEGKVAHLSYDDKGRVVQETGLYGVPTNTTTYSYDSAGNLDQGGPYDDKVNFRRTNKVWMFIDRQYSVNNPFDADAYNINWLTTHIGTINTEDSYTGEFFYNYYSEAYLTYAPRR